MWWCFSTTTSHLDHCNSPPTGDLASPFVMAVYSHTAARGSLWKYKPGHVTPLPLYHSEQNLRSVQWSTVVPHPLHSDLLSYFSSCSLCYSHTALPNVSRTTSDIFLLLDLSTGCSIFLQFSSPWNPHSQLSHLLQSLTNVSFPEKPFITILFNCNPTPALRPLSLPFLFPTAFLLYN